MKYVLRIYGHLGFLATFGFVQHQIYAIAMTGTRKVKKELGFTKREIATAYIHERYRQKKTVY